MSRELIPTQRKTFSVLRESYGAKGIVNASKQSNRDGKRFPWETRPVMTSAIGLWAESKHPRDSHGRFTSGGDTEPKRNWTDKLPDGMKSESWKEHFDANPDEGGKPNADRQKLHDRIKGEFLNVAPPVTGMRKIAIMTMGAPASGKSSAVRAALGDDDKHFVRIDPDSIKEKLPEYQKFLDPKNTYRGAAAHVHEESSYLAKQVMKDAISQGHNMIVDGTGANLEKFAAKLKAIKAAGYEVHVMMPHIELSEGRARRDARAEHTGRFVPDAELEKGYKGIPRNVSAIAKMADSFRLYDNKNSARLVYEKTREGKHIDHDPEFMKAFRANHPQV